MNDKYEMYRLNKVEGKTLDEIGQIYHLTKQRVDQLITLVEEEKYLEKHDPLALKLPRRVYRALQRAKLSAAEAKEMNITELIEIRNIGAKAAIMIKSL